MNLSLPEGRLENALGAVARVGGRDFPLWPAKAQVRELGDPRIFAVHFGDEKNYREAMIRAVLDHDTQGWNNLLGYGGNKIRGAATWNSPTGKLLTLRALLLFCQARGVTEAHTVDRWANIYQTGEYSAPHAHYESEAAAVYFLDTGEDVPEAPLSGKFELIDSRVPWCCSSRAECPTRGLMPEIRPGVMLLFPATLLHFVHPYAGRRPRITLAWNLSAGPEPPDNEARMAQQVEGKIGIDPGG